MLQHKAAFKKEAAGKKNILSYIAEIQGAVVVVII
jgi:hypothetical protein